MVNLSRALFLFLPMATLTLAADTPVSVQTFTYKTVGPLEIHLDVYGATGEVKKPVLVWIHGGALIGGLRDNLHKDQLALYLDAGFAVVSIDYRLAPETKLAEIIEDVRDAFRWVRTEGAAHFPIDPDRLAVVGHSAGGYLSLMTGFCIDPKPKAVVSFYGYGDLIGPWYSEPDPYYRSRPLVSREEAFAAVGSVETSGERLTADRFRFYLYCRQNGLWPELVSGHDPRTEPGFFTPYCPLRNVSPSYPPTLLLHGDADTDVPWNQSALMAEEFRRQGVEHEFMTIPGGPHVFDHAGGGVKGNDSVKRVFEKVVSFLKANASP
jgi:acetyl esterase/lipase